MGLHFTIDGFRVIYGVLTTFMWLMSLLASAEYMKHHDHKPRYYVFTGLTYLATMGVFFSADLFTTWVFFEIMSFASYVWVAQEEKKDALRAAGTYLAIAVIGGLAMLMGLVLLYYGAGTLYIDDLNGIECTPVIRAAGYLMLVGFGAKAGMFPLHIWLPKAYPVAPAPASALLSGVLTKAGVFGIVILTGRIFVDDLIWGRILLILALCTVLIGAVLAIFSVNIKRVLACSSVSQIGFILTGAAMMVLSEEKTVAAGGTMLYMINHSLFKLTLFLIAGVIYTGTHSLDINRVQGYGRKKPLLHILFLCGALGIAGIPGFSGYISKTLVHISMEEGSKVAEWLFLIGGGFTLAYMLKLYIAIFLRKNADEELQKTYDEKRGFGTIPTVIAVVLSAAGIPVMGLFPGRTMEKLAKAGISFFLPGEEFESVSYFTAGNLKGILISILIGIVLYLLLVFLPCKKNGTDAYPDLWPKWLDLEDAFYRPLLLYVLPYTCAFIGRIPDTMADMIVVFLRKTVYRDCPIRTEITEGTRITYNLGNAWDAVRRAGCRIFHKNYNENKGTGAHRLAVLRTQIRENRRIITRSMSFGLLMFCLGLCITMIMLLFV